MSKIKRWIENEAEWLGITFDEVVAGHEFLHQKSDEDAPPSCFTCKHVKTWHQSQTREEPEDSGCECNHPDQVLINKNWVKPENGEDDTEEQLALYSAQHCPVYEFFDWDSYRIAEEKCLATELEAQSRYAKIYREFGF